MQQNCKDQPEETLTIVKKLIGKSSPCPAVVEQGLNDGNG